MAPNSLYKRLDSLGIAPSDLRPGRGLRPGKGGMGVTPISTPGPVTPITPMRDAHTHAQQSRAALFPRPAHPPTLALVTHTTTAAAEIPGLENVRQKRLQQPRLVPDVLEAVADVRRQLSAALGHDVTDGEVFEWLIREKLQGWLDEKLAAIRAARNGGTE